MAESNCFLSGCKNCTQVTGDGSAPSLTVEGQKVFFCSYEHLWQYEDEQKMRAAESAQLELALSGTT